MIAHLPVLALGLILRLLALRYASKSFIDSFTYSPMDQWDSLMEGIYLKEQGFSPYDNNVVHQPPLALTAWANIIPFVKGWEFIPFLVMELIMVSSLLVFTSVCIPLIVKGDKSRRNVNALSKELVLSNSHFNLVPNLVVICYCMNPYSVVAFAAQSTSIVWNVIGVWSIIASLSGHYFIASCLCAFGCYLRFYPGYMLLPILTIACGWSSSDGLVRRVFRTTCSLIGFIVTLGCLLWISFLLEGRSWLFLNSVYMHQLTFADCTPQLGVYWYMFVEMFEHFQDLFVWVFQILLPVLIIALILRFYYDPVYLCFVVAFLINVLQPYHSVGEFGYLLSLFPLWRHLVEHARLLLITPCVLLSALVLTPLFRYMWLQPGTANANFYFAACMVYAVGQNFLFSDLLNAYDKREYILRVGSVFKLKSGQDLVLSHG